MTSRAIRTGMKTRLPKEMKERLLAAARGKRPPVTEEAGVRVAPEVLLRLLTTENRRLLAMARETLPCSRPARSARRHRFVFEKPRKCLCPAGLHRGL